MSQLAAEDKTVNRQEGCPLTFYGTGVNNTLSKSQMYNYSSRAYLKYNLGLLIWPDAQNLLYDNSASANLTGQETQAVTVRDRWTGVMGVWGCSAISLALCIL